MIMIRRCIAWTITIVSLQLGLYAQSPSVPYVISEERIVPDEERAVRGDKLKGYRLLPDIGMPIQVELLDTITPGTYRHLSPENRSVAVGYLGNSNSSWMSKLFFDRDRRLPDFIYRVGYQGMLFRPETIRFYDTKTPFTLVRYQQNFDDTNKEEQVYSTLSTNLGKMLNLGVELNHVNAKGYYESNQSKNTSYRLFGSLRTDRYDLWLSLGNDYYVQAENGGVTDMDYLLHPERYTSGRTRIESKDIPVLLPGNLYFNSYRSGHAFLSHRYKLGYYRALTPSDSVEARRREEVRAMSGDESTPPDTMLFVPVGGVAHTLFYNKESRRSGTSVESSTWDTIFGKPIVYHTRGEGEEATRYVFPNDTAQLTTLHNTMSLSLMEGFYPWVKFGLSGYFRAENYWVSNPDSLTGGYRNVDKFFSGFVGGMIDKSRGEGLLFRAKAEFGVVGKDLGAMHLSGDLSTTFRLGKHRFSLQGDAQLLNSRPPYFAAHHHGTFGWWDRDLDFVRRLEFGGRVSLKDWGAYAEVRTATLQNHLYWDAQAQPQQYSSAIQTTMLRLGHSNKWRSLGWELEGAYQLSSEQDILPLPQLSARAGLYLDVLIVRVLRMQLGVDAYWHSAYHAPYYHPTVQQFVNQHSERVGGDDPLINAYANFRLKRTRFFIKMYNIGEMLMSSKRLSLYKYPHNPNFLSVGVVMDFAN